MSNRQSLIIIENETEGSGCPALRGDTVTKRTVIAGLECGVTGMRVSGKRRFRAGPHLAYRGNGVEGVIPPNAVLVFEVDLLKVTRNARLQPK